MLPQRTRLSSGDYILDIIEAQYTQKLYYYTVHNTVSGEIVAFGHEQTFVEAQRAAEIGMQTALGRAFSFAAANAASSVA
jgi:hypothetical protein